MSNLNLNKSEFKAILLKLREVNIPNTSTIIHNGWVKNDDIYLTACIGTRKSFCGYTYDYCFSVVVGSEKHGDYECKTIK